MAAAMGAAILLPTAEAMALFAALGFGIALPFLLIAFVPTLRRLLPKPGPWLDRFRKWMAVPMGLTALALLWLLSRLAGTEGLWIGLFAATLMMLLLAAYRYTSGRLRYAPLLLVLGAGGLIAGGNALLPDAPSQAKSSEGDFPGAVKFDAGELAELRARGTPVFLYFTADWCVTCKVNEAAAINREETIALFRDKGITVMVGDFTRRDAAIARFLADHGRSGVPLYLFYPANGEARELPQILTPAIVAEAVGL